MGTGGVRKGAGRKPKPKEIKLLQGTFRKDRDNPDAPPSIEGVMEMLWERDPLTTEWFNRLVAYLKMEHRGSKTDEAILWLAARRCAEIQLLDPDVAMYGRVYFKDGLMKSNPAVKQLNDALRHLHSLLSELGLTPASRNRVSTDLKDKTTSQSAWADFGVGN